MFASILLLGSISAVAQGEESVVPFIPQENSPFFVVKDAERRAASGRETKVLGPQAAFPRNKGAERSGGEMFTGFFTEMFASVNLQPSDAKSGSKLVVDPQSFSLDDRREVTVNFSVFNRTNKLVKLEFPTQQRIEIIVRDPSGKVIEKWSDDRAFADQAGVVMINPDERIEYSEQIATREMVPGTTYTIEASLVNNPEFTRTTQVTPTGTAALPPAPVPGNSPEQPANREGGGEPPAGPAQG